MRKYTNLILSLLIVMSGCTSQPKVIKEDTVQNSHVTISYHLGHSRYQFFAQGLEDQAEISSWKDDKMLERKIISLEQYLSFSELAHQAIKNFKDTPIESDCRTPFQIEFSTQNEALKISGCRSEKTQSQIGQVIKEGEYLLYTEEK